MDLYENLELLKKRPRMFMYGTTITDLYTYISGYLIGNKGKENLNPSFDLFNDYIAVVLGYTSSTAGWVNMLHEYYKDPKIALDKFFEHLDDFKRDMKGKTCIEMGEFLKSKGYELHYNFSEEYGCGK